MAKLENEIIVILMESPGLSAAMISRRLRERFFGGVLKCLLWDFASSATIYPALAKMEQQGLLTSRWGMQAGGKPRRRMYFVANASPPVSPPPKDQS